MPGRSTISTHPPALQGHPVCAPANVSARANRLTSRRRGPVPGRPGMAASSLRNSGMALPCRLPSLDPIPSGTGEEFPERLGPTQREAAAFVQPRGIRVKFDRRVPRNMHVLHLAGVIPRRVRRRRPPRVSSGPRSRRTALLCRIPRSANCSVLERPTRRETAARFDGSSGRHIACTGRPAPMCRTIVFGPW